MYCRLDILAKVIQETTKPCRKRQGLVGTTKVCRKQQSLVQNEKAFFGPELFK